MNHEEKDALIAELKKALEDNGVLLVTANDEIVLLKGTISQLETIIKENETMIQDKDQQILAITSLKEKTEADLEDVRAALEDHLRKSLDDNTSTLLESVTAERDNALAMITELSAQVADQASVKTEKEILVKVDGEKYLLAKRPLHTLNGEVKPEDAAKDKDFLRQLIEKGSGAIRKADK